MALSAMWEAPPLAQQDGLARSRLDLRPECLELAEACARQRGADDLMLSFYVDHMRRKAALPGVQEPDAASPLRETLS